MARSILRRLMGRRSRRKYKVNVRLCVILAVVVAAGAGLVHLVHGFQVERNADSVFIKAKRSYEDNRPGRAIIYMRQFVSLNPKDPGKKADGWALLGEWLEKHAQGWRGYQDSFLCYEQALALDSSRDDLRRGAIRTAATLQKYQRALDLLDPLKQRDSELLLIESRCYREMNRYTEAAKALRRAIETAPAEPQPYKELIALLERRRPELSLDPLTRFFARDAGQVADAAAAEDAEQPPDAEPPLEVPSAENLIDRVIERMIAKARPEFEGLIVRARSRYRGAKLDLAAADIALACAQAPENAGALLLATEIEHRRATQSQQRGDSKEAERYRQAALELGRKGLALDPPELRFFLTMSQLEAEAGDYAAAETVLRNGIAAADKLLAGEKNERRIEFHYRNLLVWSLANTLISQAVPERKSPGEAVEPRQETLAEVEQLIERLKRSEMRGAGVDFLNARIVYGERKWANAARLFEKARPGLRDLADAVHSIDQALGDCYTHLLNPDARLRAYRRASEEYPEWEPNRLGYAQSLAAIGRIDDALTEFRRPILAKIPGVQAAIAQLLVRRQLELPRASRHWNEVASAVAKTQGENTDATGSMLLKAELLIHEGNFDEAQALLEQARDREPSELPFWAALVRLPLARTDLEEAERISRAERALDAARMQLGQRLELHLLAVQVALYRDEEGSLKRLAEIEQETTGLPPDERRRLCRVIAQAYLGRGAAERGLELWQPLARTSPEGLDDQLLLADLAARADAPEAWKEALHAIGQIEGENGPNGDYLEAMNVILKYKRHGGKGELRHAEMLLTDAGRLRPSWPAIWRSLGLVHELRGNRDEAFEQFKHAIELGDRSRETVAWVVDYLIEKQQFSDAQEVLDRAVDTADTLSGDMARLASRVAAALANLDDASKFADRIPQKAKNLTDVLWEAELALAKGIRGAEIEALAKQATEMAPHQPRAWLARVKLLAYEGKADEARKIIEEAGTKLPVEPRYARPLVLGQCYELLDDRAAAQSQFEQAVAVAPKESVPRMALVDFYIRSEDFERARPHVELLQSESFNADEPVRKQARRIQAVIVANKGRYDDLMAGLSVLPPIQTDRQLEKADDQDLMTIVNILSRSRLKRERPQLIRVLEALDKRKKLGAPQKLQLARLLEAQDRWRDARAMYRKLLEQQPESAPLIAEFVLSALRQPAKLKAEAMDEVAELVERLTKLEPNSPRAALARSRLLTAEGRNDEAAAALVEHLKDLQVLPLSERLHELVAGERLEEALALLEKTANEHNEPSAHRILLEVRRLMRSGEREKALAGLRKYVQEADLSEAVFAQNLTLVANALESMGDSALAERTLRQYAEASHNPARLLPLIHFVARQNKIGEALDLCERAPASATPLSMARTAIAVLRAGRPTPEQTDRVEKRLSAAQEGATPAEKPQLALLLAELREIQGRYPEMLAIYRRLVEEDARNVTALNNLAWYLSFEPAPNRASSLELINRAIQMAGPHPELLDTRAVVQMNLNHPEEAIADLDRALKDAGSPSIWFHLALAQSRSGNSGEAADAFRQAEEAGFKPETLHPLEKAGHEKLIKTLESKKASL